MALKPVPPQHVTPLAPHDDIPIIETVGMCKTPKGWVVVLLRSQGMKILDTETLNEPEPRAYAIERLKISVVQRFVMPQASDTRA